MLGESLGVGVGNNGLTAAAPTSISNFINYGASTASANCDDLAVKPAKIANIEFPMSNSLFYGEISPTNSVNIASTAGLNDSSSPTSSSSSSAAMVAAATAALFQVASGSCNNDLGLHHNSDLSNSHSNSISISVGNGGHNDNLKMGLFSGLSSRKFSESTVQGSINNDSMQPRQRRKVPEGELCAVCSDRATGYHYGVASCNGCKTFFRRTIVSEHTFVCQYQGNCDVNKNVRCACRHCRFNKCVSVGMDARAIQNDRDRIGPTKKFRMLSASSTNGNGMSYSNGGSTGVNGNTSMSSLKRNSSADDDQLSLASLSPLQCDDKLIEQLIVVEDLTNQMRTRIMDECKSVKQTLTEPCLLDRVHELEIDPQTLFKELYPASMNDIQMWNIRELRLCLEWAKTFEEFKRLSPDNQFALVRSFAFTFNILNRVFYSLDYGPDKIVYLNGAFILRQPQEQVLIPGCRSIYHRQMDEIMNPFRKMGVTASEFAAFKASLLFNPDASELTADAREVIMRERAKYLQALFYLIVNQNGMATGVKKHSELLMMAPSIQKIIDQNDENMQVMEVFGNFWRINGFVKELCMK